MKILRNIIMTACILFLIYSVIITILFFIHLSLREVDNYLDTYWLSPVYLLGSFILFYSMLLFGATMVEPVGRTITYIKRLFK